MSQDVLYLDDMQVGQKFISGTYLMSEERIKQFATEFDPQPFHLDEVAAKASILGGLCASGWHSCAMIMRMMCDGFLLETASLGAPGIEEARWSKPVFVDDVVTLHRTCLASRASASRPELGLTRFEWRLVNQRGETPVTLTNWLMLRRRHPGVGVA